MIEKIKNCAEHLEDLKIKREAKKYETTFAEIESQIEETEKELSLMIDDLEAGEFDMRGLYEFKKLLGGE